jgi:hypothetical protein
MASDSWQTGKLEERSRTKVLWSCDEVHGMRGDGADVAVVTQD